LGPPFTDRGLSSGFPLVTTRLRDKSFLIKLIGSALVSRHAGINRKASIDCRELFYASVTWKFWNDCKHYQRRSQPRRSVAARRSEGNRNRRIAQHSVRAADQREYLSLSRCADRRIAFATRRNLIRMSPASDITAVSLCPRTPVSLSANSSHCGHDGHQRRRKTT
jgi:hypothetical protein